ncbi:hypothetical protein L9F63_018894, partial [Diploptera punctata]
FTTNQRQKNVLNSVEQLPAMCPNGRRTISYSHAYSNSRRHAYSNSRRRRNSRRTNSYSSRHTYSNSRRRTNSYSRRRTNSYSRRDTFPNSRRRTNSYSRRDTFPNSRSRKNSILGLSISGSLSSTSSRSSVGCCSAFLEDASGECWFISAPSRSLIGWSSIRKPRLQSCSEEKSLLELSTWSQSVYRTPSLIYLVDRCRASFGEFGTVWCVVQPPGLDGRVEIDTGVDAFYDESHDLRPSVANNIGCEAGDIMLGQQLLRTPLAGEATFVAFYRRLGTKSPSLTAGRIVVFSTSPQSTAAVLPIGSQITSLNFLAQCKAQFARQYKTTLLHKSNDVFTYKI